MTKRKLLKTAVAVLIIGLAFYIGFRSGIHHVAKDAEIWLNEYVQPAEGDWEINVTVDGETFPQVLWIY